MSRRRRRVVQTNTPARHALNFGAGPCSAACDSGGRALCWAKYMELNSPDPFDSAPCIPPGTSSRARLGVDEAAALARHPHGQSHRRCGCSASTKRVPRSSRACCRPALMLMFYIAALTATWRRWSPQPLPLSICPPPLIAKYGNVKEQHMIAFMIVAACCFLLYQQSGRWWLAVCARCGGKCLLLQTDRRPLSSPSVCTMLLQPLMKRSRAQHRM